MHRNKTRIPSFALVVLVIGGTSPSIAADGYHMPVGSEFRVNTHTAGDQHGTGPFAIDGRYDRFVVVWQSELQDGDQSGIIAQRFEGDGNRVGGEILVNGYTTGRQFSPAVTMDDDGSFVVAWASESPGETTLSARRFDAAGSPQGAEFPVNTSPAGVDEPHASIASLGGAGFIVVWEAIKEISASYDVMGRRFDATGSPLGDEFRVNATAAAAQRQPSVAANPSGAVVVAWSSENADGDGSGIRARRFAADGAPVTGDMSVNTTTAGVQDEPDVKVDEDGSFVIVWTSRDGQDGDASGVFGQQFDATGIATGAEFQVNTSTTGDQEHPAIDGNGYGTYVVSWQDDGEISGQSLYHSGFKFEGEFLVNTHTTGEQTHPGVAGAWDFVIVWTSEGQFDGADVVAQRYAMVGASSTSQTTYTTYTTYTTTTTLLPNPRCGQPVTTGPQPVATDCAFILNVAVGVGTCSPECICAPNGALPLTAVDALVCLAVAVGAPGPALDCPCE